MPILVDHGKDDQVVTDSDNVVRYLNKHGKPPHDLHIEQTCKFPVVEGSQIGMVGKQRRRNLRKFCFLSTFDIVRMANEKMLAVRRKSSVLEPEH